MKKVMKYKDHAIIYFVFFFFFFFFIKSFIVELKNNIYMHTYLYYITI